MSLVAYGFITREYDQYKVANVHIREGIKCRAKVLLTSYFFSYRLLFECEYWKVQKENEGTKTCKLYLTKNRMDMLRPKPAQFGISGKQVASF